jgi:hypothetical protein
MDAFRTSQKLCLMLGMLLRLDPAQVDMTTFYSCHMAHFANSLEGQSLGLDSSYFSYIRTPEGHWRDAYGNVAHALGITRGEAFEAFSSYNSRASSLAKLAALITRYKAREHVPA